MNEVHCAVDSCSLMSKAIVRMAVDKIWGMRCTWRLAVSTVLRQVLSVLVNDATVLLRSNIYTLSMLMSLSLWNKVKEREKVTV